MCSVSATGSRVPVESHDDHSSCFMTHGDAALLVAISPGAQLDGIIPFLRQSRNQSLRNSRSMHWTEITEPGNWREAPRLTPSQMSFKELVMGRECERTEAQQKRATETRGCKVSKINPIELCKFLIEFQLERFRHCKYLIERHRDWYLE
jgi:hypothetical protein